MRSVVTAVHHVINGIFKDNVKQKHETFTDVPGDIQGDLEHDVEAKDSPEADSLSLKEEVGYGICRALAPPLQENERPL